MLEEMEMKRGKRYKYWVYTRLDWHWLEPPPPIALFESTDPNSVWIPDGNDWDGLNDRFALVPRRWTHAYFGRWPRLLNGTFLGPMRQAAPKPPRGKFYGGPEWSLMAGLWAFGTPVSRFAGTGAILCLNSKRARYGRCTRKLDPTGFMFKYSAEASEAHLNVGRLRMDGWEWRSSPRGPSIDPPCFESDDVGRSCCSRRSHGVAGDGECWTDVYDFSRCCGGLSRPGLWILPTVVQARDYLVTGRFPTCWPMVSSNQRCLSQADLEYLSQAEET
eukprot:TRINITY_DN82884_c0_g1_i1.p1 TRINITY_DN82884_c0_g1~~TRINITY_DN82884_c0_g1_i1.p1  ORF type:complete len:275 (-),score=26.82 TRINITY_DN82884_c0_g1_i1:264-1088(-)